MRTWSRIVGPGLCAGPADLTRRGDLLAGITVAAYLIPQVMGYAAVAGLPAVAGLWAICAALAVYALLGSSRQLSVGPESTTAIMTAVVIGPLAAGDPARYGALCAALAVIVGLVCVAAAATRLGFLADLLSKPVLVGYMAGIAAIMVVGQIGRMTGTDIDGQSFVAQVRSFLVRVDDTRPAALAIAASTLIALVAAYRVAPRAPATLVTILVAAAATRLLGLDSEHVTVVGHIPSGMPTPRIPDVSGRDVADLLVPAVGVAIVGFSDNMLTARAFAGRRRYTVDANRELLALGAANVAAGSVSGFPVSSSASRTAIGDAVGGRTQLQSLVALGTVALVMIVGRPVLASFPVPALGAIVAFAAGRLVDVNAVRELARIRRSELVLCAVTAGAVLAFDVLYGVLIAIGLSVIDVLRRVARPHDGILGFVDGVAGMHDVDDYPDARREPGLVVYRYDAPLFFANAGDFKSRAIAAVDDAPDPPRWLLLNVEAIVDVDSTAIEALDQLRDELDRRNVTMALARVKHDLRVVLERTGFIDRIGPHRVFMTLPTAVEAFRQESSAGSTSDLGGSESSVEPDRPAAR